MFATWFKEILNEILFNTETGVTDHISYPWNQYVLFRKKLTAQDIETHTNVRVPLCRVDSHTFSLHGSWQRVGYYRISVRIARK